MTSGLAAQLAQYSSLNASLYVDRSRRKHTESYLFPNRDANEHDFYSLHALGLNGLSKLKALNPGFGKYEGTIFSDSSRNADRTLQSQTQNADLDRVLDDFLKHLGPYLMEPPASKALEWVIRRFRANEFNIDSLMALFIPYHETPHFTKLVSILHIETDLWRFLIPLKNAAQPLPRVLLINEMVKNRDLARFIFNLLPESLEGDWSHHTLVGFTAGVAVEYIARQKRMKEDTLAFVLPAASRLCSPKSTQECVLVGYTIFAALSHRCRLKSDVLNAILAEMLKGHTHVEATQFISFTVAFLAPQDLLQDLPDSITKQIMMLPRLPYHLVECLKWAGSERLIIALLPALLRRISDTSVVEVLDNLLLSPVLLESIVQNLTENLLLQCDPLLAESQPVRLLRTIYQKFPSIYSRVVSNVTSEVEEPDMRDKVGALTRLVTLPSFALSGVGQLLLSSRLEEANSRQHAVRDLIRQLKDEDFDADIRKDVEKALRDRVFDEEVAVLEVLYDSPSVVLPIFNDMSFITSVSTALVSSDIPRGIMRLHFNFIAGPFFEKHPEFAAPVFESIFLPFILYTRPRQKTAQLAWDILKSSPFATYELLSGCKDILSKHTIGETTRTEDMAKINLDVATQIAENILSSASFPTHLDMLLRLVRHADAHTRNMTYLICRFLLNLLSGVHQIDTAQRLLIAMDVHSLSDLQDQVPGKTNIQDAISDDALSRAIVAKPNSNGTAHRLQLSILALIPVLKRPPGVAINWLPNETPTTIDKRGIIFAALMRDMYKLINTLTGHPLSSVLLKALFVNLREEALLLLVGVWTHCLLNKVPDSEHLVQTALSHTLAFLHAHVQDLDSPQDFQTIIPALLLALHTDSKSIRSCAMDCIVVIAQSTKSSSASTVYAVDTVYGDRSGVNLQYLEWSDFNSFMTALESYRKHCTNDNDYLGIVSQDLLQARRADSKKDASHKEKVLCYLLSHILAWDCMEARIILLRMIKNVSHEVKLQMLLPALQAFISGDQLRLPDGNSELVLQYWQLLLHSYDLSAVSELSDSSSSARDIFVKLIRACFKSDLTPSDISKSLLDQLSGDVFSQLPLDLQLEICVILIESATVASATKPLIKENFGPLLNNADLIVSLLSHFQPPKKDDQQRASKRVKTTSDSNNPDIVAPDFLTVCAEIFVAYPMPGSPDLLGSLLNTLAAICHGQSIQSEAHYMIQLFMTIIQSAISSISDTTKLVPNTLRMEILVELLRISDNPQTFNQALLVIASMARLAPEFVMQNVMPIFTFMGSNVFHRDDSYSFRVVQKTIDSIVPVVVGSLKVKHPEPFGLLKASGDFLRVFTDAATHVPRHRRTQFFIHFVDILGRDDFLIPVCLLLIDKSHRVVRQKSPEAAGTLGLPVAIIQAQNKTPPFKIVYQLLQEAANLYAISTSNEPLNEIKTFLDVSKDDAVAKMQINAVLVFVDVLLRQSVRTGSMTDTASINDSITLLLGFANAVTVSSEGHVPQYLDIPGTAVKTLGRLLGIISVSEFISSIDVILKTNNNLIEIGALNLLASRLADVSPKTRLDVAPSIVNILTRICSIVENGTDIPFMKAALTAFQSVALSAVDQEIPSLAKALPLLLKAADRFSQLTASVLKCIIPLSTKLGPRILPVFRDVVRFCDGILRGIDAVPDEKERNSVIQDVQTSLINLLNSIPQFWTVDDLVGLIGLTLESSVDTLEIRRTISKRVPSQQLLPALLRVWASSIPQHLREIFFDLVKRVMRGSERSAVYENLRDIFKLFLEAFEDLQNTKKDFSNLENLYLGSFVEFVTKLNEAAFKPLYRRLFDWAFNDPTDNRVNRQITFCSALISLIKLLKGLITPYLDVALNPLLELLNDPQSETNLPFELWAVSIALLDTSLEFDEGAFWRVERLNKLGPCLVKQLGTYPSLSSRTEGAQILQSCLNNLVSVLEDDLSLKKLHLDILMQTRSEEPDVRLFTIQTLVSLWELQGEKLTGFLTDIITFIVECAEDEHDDVSKAARILKRTVEKRTGSLDALLGK